MAVGSSMLATIRTAPPQWAQVVTSMEKTRLSRCAQLIARRFCSGLRGIVSRVRWPMHTGQLEGINNKIKVIKRMAYGFRDSSYFFLKIKAAFPGNP